MAGFAPPFHGNIEMKLIAVQQSVMTALGFYDGDIDGVWGPKCVAAMNRWQLEDSFDPALPNNGYFFTPPSRLPKGLSWAAGRSGELQYFGMSADIRAKVDKLMAEQYKPITIQRVNEEVLGTAKPEVKEAKVADPVPEPVPEVAPAAAPVQQSQGNQQQQNNQQRNNNQRR